MKPIQFRPPAQQSSQQNDLRPASENQVYFDHPPHKNQINRPPQKQVNFIPQSISTPRTKQVQFDLKTTMN